MGAAAVAMQTSVAEMTNPILERLTPALAAVPGVAAIVLGGSRARGTARPHSDTDIGLYYRRGEEPAAARLREALRSLVDDPVAAVVTEVGEWGPWIVGGAWLSIGGKKVDLLYRCVEAVEEVVRACRGGDVRMDYQPGHPHGFCSAIWMGEVALCRPLHDLDGALAVLKAMTEPYPELLRQALIRRFVWEVLFSIENGEIAVARGDQTHVAGCAYRALCCVGQVLFALNRRYLINEKGALDEAADFPTAVPRLAERVSNVWQAIGRRDFRHAFHELRSIERELKALAGNDSPA
jgi:predicted nucleotidyltransferase